MANKRNDLLTREINIINNHLSMGGYICWTMVSVLILSLTVKPKNPLVA